MNLAIRSARNHLLTLFSSPIPPPPRVGRKAARAVKLRSFATSSTQSSRPEESEDNSNMDKRKEEEDDKPTVLKTGDAMAHSFGEGYGTRSGEEGFGGIYRGNDSYKLMKAKEIDEDHSEYDKSQGCEVREKEKARHQTTASS